MNTTKSKSKSTARKTPAKRSANAGQGASDNMLKQLFTDSLKDIYWAEKALVTTLPKMEKAATSTELKDALTEHLEITKTHVSRLEEVFGSLDQKPQAKKCEAMEGLIKEGETIIEETEQGTNTRDVGIIMAGQKVEHYEIATYGGLRQLAVTLGLDDVAMLLNETLEEEKEADVLLSDIAENDINYQAAEETEA